jgi:hypothetical protein
VTGISALLVAIILLVVSNYNSGTCSEAAVFEYWTKDSLAAGCTVYDHVNPDWTAPAPIMTLNGAFPAMTVEFATAAASYKDRHSYGAYLPVPGDSALESTVVAFQFVDIDLRDQSAKDGSDTLYVRISAISIFPRFQIHCALAGYVRPRAMQSLQPGYLELGPYTVNWTAPLSNVNILRTNYNNSAAALVLSRFYENFPLVISTFTSYAFLDFQTSRHIQRCNVCIAGSPVSISWIIIIGSIQAFAIINKITGWCIRSYNRKASEEPPLLQNSSGEAPTISIPSLKTPLAED